MWNKDHLKILQKKSNQYINYRYSKNNNDTIIYISGIGVDINFPNDRINQVCNLLVNNFPNTNIFSFGQFSRDLIEEINELYLSATAQMTVSLFAIEQILKKYCEPTDRIIFISESFGTASLLYSIKRIKIDNPIDVIVLNPKCMNLLNDKWFIRTYNIKNRGKKFIKSYKSVKNIISKKIVVERALIIYSEKEPQEIKDEAIYINKFLNAITDKELYELMNSNHVFKTPYNFKISQEQNEQNDKDLIDRLIKKIRQFLES